MKLKLRSGQRNILVFALIVRRIWKRCRLPEQRLLWYDSARRRWMISTRHAVGLYWVPGHAGVRGNEIADKLARDGSVQRFVGPEPFLGVSGQNIRRWKAGWKNNIWYSGVVLVVHIDRLENRSLSQTWLHGPDYCPLIGHNPGLLSCLLDITPCEDIYNNRTEQ
jgi:hypothetical protein